MQPSANLGAKFARSSKTAENLSPRLLKDNFDGWLGSLHSTINAVNIHNYVYSLAHGSLTISQWPAWNDSSVAQRKNPCSLLPSLYIVRAGGERGWDSEWDVTNMFYIATGDTVFQVRDSVHSVCTRWLAGNQKEVLILDTIQHRVLLEVQSMKVG